MENVIKSVFFTPCFKKFSFTDHILFKISTISPRHYNVPGKLCYWMIFLEDYGTWKWKFFIFKILVFSNLDAFPDKTYEKTCSFYNIFSKLISNFTRLTSFYHLNNFSQKNGDCFNIMFVFLTLNHFSSKNYEKVCRFITNFQSSCHIVHAHKLW